MTPSSPAFDRQLVLAHAKGLRSLARHLVGDAHLADDLVQDAMLAVVRRPPAAGVPLGPWLVGIVRNLAKMTHRTETRRAARERHASPPAQPESAGDAVARVEAHRRLADAVLALPEPYRTAIAMRYLDGLEPAEIARRSGVPAATVRTHVHRGLALLRERLHEEDDRRGAWLLVLAGGDGAPDAPVLVRRTAMSSTAAAVVGGVLLTKKLVAAALVALLAVAWFATRDEHSSAAKAPSAAVQVATHESASEPRTRETIEDPAPIVPPAVAPDTRPRLSGVVLDTAGVPVAGATILAQPMFESTLSPTATSADATTGADGRFEVRPPDVAGLFRVLVDARELGIADAEDVRGGDDVTIQLTPTVTVTGRVVDLDAKPIAGASVRWVGAVERSAVLGRATVAGADGVYRLTGIPSRLFGQTFVNNENSNLVAEAEGFAPLTVHWTGSPRTLDLRLVRGASLLGRVLDGETGAPIDGAKVVVWTFERAATPDGGASGIAPRRGPAVLGELRTGADGRFEFPHVPANGFHRLPQAGSGSRGQLVGSVGAFAPGFAPGADEIPIRDDGDAIDCTIRLWPAAFIEGRVVGATGEPVAGLWVYGFSPDLPRAGSWVSGPIEGAPPNRALTGADGRYRIESARAVRSGPTRVTVRAESKLLRQAFPTGGVQLPEADVSVRSGETVQAPDIVYAPKCASIRVVVTDAAGRPVWGARSANASQELPPRGGIADREGRIEHFVPYLNPSEKNGVVLAIRAPGFMPATTPPTIPSVESPPELRVTLTAGRRVSGRVMRADGTPASGLLVLVGNGNIAAELLFPKEGSAKRKWDDPSLPALKDYGSCSTNEDGRFEAFELPEGPYTLRIMGPSAWALVENVATDARDVEVEVPGLPPTAPEPNGSLEVVFTDVATGAPVAHPSAWLSRGGGWNQGTWAAPVADAATGVLRWPDLATGEWTLSPSVVGFESEVPRKVTVKSGETTRLTVALRCGATVRGTVTADEGVNLVELGISLLHNEGWGGSSTTLKGDSTYEIRGVRPGRFHAVVQRPNPGEAQYAIEGVNLLDVPADGGELRFDLRVVRAGTIGIVAGGTWPASDCPRYAICDALGGEVAAGPLYKPDVLWSLLVPPGTYDVTLKSSGSEPATKRVTVEAGGRENLRF